MPNVSPTEPTPSELPTPVPEEVAALGKPERVHLPDQKQFERNCLLARVLSGAVGLMLAVFAILILCLAKHKPDLTGVADVVPLGLIGAAVPFIALAICFRGARWGDSWWGPRTFLVYPDALVELRGGRHRTIPWKTIGAQLPAVPLAAPYRFAVERGGPLSFDKTVGDHEALFATIKKRAHGQGAAAVVWTGGDSLADETAQAEMATAVPSKPFLVHQLGGSIFRVTALGKRLLFNKLKEGDGLAEYRPNMGPVVALGAVGGLIGGFNTWMATARRHAYLDEKQQLDRADAKTLLAYAAEVAGSFAISPEEVRTIDLDPPSLWKHLFKGIDGTRQACLLKLSHVRCGDLLLELLSDEDVLTAVQELQRIFGEAVRVNVTYSYSQCAFVAK
jgi:hypothetical protein